MTPLLCIGELLIDFVSSQPDVSLIDAPAFVKAPGGAPANVAVAATRQGCEASFIGQVGDDPFGAFLRQTLEGAGLTTDHLLTSADARTTLAFVATRSDGKKDIAFYRNPGADMLLTADQLPIDALKNCKCLHFGSVSLSKEPARSATMEAVRIARESGALISFDPNWRPALWDDHDEARQIILDAMPIADIVKLADEEWEFITGTPDFDEGAKAILQMGPKLCLITKGADGAYFNDGRHKGDVPGFTVTVADTLGAGDAFMGTVLAELIRVEDLSSLTEDDLMRILKRGNAAGAITCTGTGVIPSLPTWATIDCFLEG